MSEIRWFGTILISMVLSGISFLLAKVQETGGATRGRLVRIVRIGGFVACAALSSLNCAGDKALAPDVDLSQVYWKLQLNHHAVTLSVDAPSNTLRLIATPLSPLKTPLVYDAAQASVVTYTVSDVRRVTVSPDGEVTATSPGSNVRIIAQQTIGGVTLMDTVLVNITMAGRPSPLTTFSIQPSIGDSTKLACCTAYSKVLSTLVLDSDSLTIPNALIAYRSGDTTIALVSTTGVVTPMQRPGTTYITAETNHYGVAMKDSIPFTVGLPLGGYIIVTPAAHGGPVPILTFNPPVRTIGVGGTIRWANGSQDHPIDVVFDDSTAVEQDNGSWLFAFPRILVNGSGNIPPFAIDSTDTDFYKTSQYRSRSFTKPGNYKYCSKLYGTCGVIIVQAE